MYFSQFITEVEINKLNKEMSQLDEVLQKQAYTGNTGAEAEKKKLLLKQMQAKVDAANKHAKDAGSEVRYKVQDGKIVKAA
jgi:hypothetical protein